jgi:MarR family transcriptional regulator, organic hydroperoxide resistance regulator
MKMPSPIECPYYLLSRATLAITSILKRDLSKAGLENIKPAYLGVFLSISKDESLKANELGKRIGLEPSSMTGLLDRMERDGLLKRTPDPEDRRAHKIMLTQEGIKAQFPSLNAVSDILDKIFNDVSKDNFNLIKKTLKKILANCNKEATDG